MQVFGIMESLIYKDPLHVSESSRYGRCNYPPLVARVFAPKSRTLSGSESDNTKLAHGYPSTNVRSTLTVRFPTVLVWLELA